MFNANNLNVNEMGHLTIGGVDAVNIAKEFKTPLYVMDEDLIKENCKEFKNSIDEFYNGNGMVCYASKAFSCKEIYRVMADEGMGIDVVSEGELYTAISTSFPTDRICFHGNNKTKDEITYALRYGVKRIVVDNIDELESINEIAGNQHVKAGVYIRIKPGIDAHTHDFIRTGQIDSKFGFALETGEAFKAVKTALEMENINLTGVHCHIGSQIFDVEPFKLAAEVMLGFILKVKNELGHVITDLNLGGGFGIKYTDEDSPLGYREYMKNVAETINDFCNKNNMDRPFIIIEPGRSIVGPAGVTLYKVGNIKNIPNIRDYVTVNGSMADNPRYALYSSKYDMLIANKANKPKDFVATVAGKCCESGDLIGENVKIQEPEKGDILAVLSTGAYNYSMASNYNRLTKPAVISVKNGKVRLIVRRETMDDLIKYDI